ncbi:MAG TPA: amidohydrolase [Candidatus Thermoplasmatota archaeon]
MARGFALTNAEIYTSDPAQPRAESILVLGQRVAAVGSETKILAKARKEGVPIQDLRGRTVTPGIIDSHTHLIHQGLLRERLDLRETKSLEEALDRVRKAVARRRTTDLFLAERWDESRWKEKRYPRLHELNDISTTIPIVMRRVDGHIAVANDAACRILAPLTPGVDALEGLLIEEASLNLNQLFPTPVDQTERALEHGQKQALKLGVTTVHDFVVPNYVRAYRRLHAKGRFAMRAHLSLYVEYLDGLERVGLGAGWGDERLRLHGIKLFGDGSLGGHTAALHAPYNDTGGRGKLNWTDTALVDVFRRAHASDLHISAHAIGDAAIDQVARTFQALGGARRRHRIEHFELHTEESVEILRKNHLVASMQPNFVGEWSRPGGMYHKRLGAKRNRHNNEFKALLKDGVAVAFGSDCMPFDPWFGIQSCVTAPFAAQRLSLAEALGVYTRGSAWGIGRERDLGTLKAGYLADLNVVALDPRKPSKANVLATYVGGQRIPS